MCGIVASFNKEKLIELYKINAYRGELSHSISIYNPIEKTIIINRYSDKIDFNRIIINKNEYCIIHSQAPTTKKDNLNIHPAQYYDTFLWHNGIIKDFEVTRLRDKYNIDTLWDTELLLQELNSVDYLNNLSTINGSFAGIFFDSKKELYVFRNEIAPLFVDSNMNISSTRFDNTTILKPNIFFKLDLESKTLIETGKFETLENPYNF